VPVKRHSIYNRVPVAQDSIEFVGCPLSDTHCDDCASENSYCKWDEDTDKCDYHTFRLVRISEELNEDEASDLLNKIQFVKNAGCYIRLITDVPLPNEVLFALGYDPLNVIQFNINILESSEEYLRRMKGSIFIADNCGLYVGLMVYPIVPGVTKSYDVLEFLNSFRCACNNICFKYLELPSNTKITKVGLNSYFNVNGYVVTADYYMQLGDMWVVNSYYRRTFSTIMTRFLTPRKVNCSCCNDHICY
jgi:hypothetical protein